MSCATWSTGCPGSSSAASASKYRRSRRSTRTLSGRGRSSIARFRRPSTIQRFRRREFDSQAGHHRVDDAVATFCLGDVLVHTWDLARATGLDETLDADEVHRLFTGMEPVDELLRSSGHFGPRVDVPADADEQTKLIAFTGRRP